MRPVLAKVLLLTKDEPALLDDFLDYHSYLLGGAPNVVVVDNGSVDARVLSAYDRHRSRGGSVVVDTRPFGEASTIVTDHVRSLQHTCEFVIPLETDQFMCTLGVGATTPDAIQGLLESVPPDVAIVRYGRELVSLPPRGGQSDRPAREITDFRLHRHPTDPAERDGRGGMAIVRASSFWRVADYCRKHVEVSAGGTETCAALGLLHFSDAGFRQRTARAVNVLRSLGYVDLGAPIPAQLSQIAQIQARCRDIPYGHKLPGYRAFLGRKAAIFAFRHLHGRLPTPAELLRCVFQTSAEGARVQFPPSYTAAEDSVPTCGWDDLLYMDPHTPTACKTHACEHVRDVLAAAPRPTPAETRPGLHDILRRYESHHNKSGTDKTTTHAFGPLYQTLLDGYRYSATNVLEIGVYSGASCCAFAEFFENAVVDGIDISLDNVLPRFAERDRLRLRRLDGTDADTPRALGTMYDIILDDASHVPADQIRSLDLFAPYLKPGGIYIVEDINGSLAEQVHRGLSDAARRHGLSFDWHDLRHVKGQFDDIVAVMKKTPAVSSS
jgi:predicted O-methyltransferase YrrM